MVKNVWFFCGSRKFKTTECRSCTCLIFVLQIEVDKVACQVTSLQTVSANYTPAIVVEIVVELG
jgi:hypothetical protein